MLWVALYGCRIGVAFVKRAFRIVQPRKGGVSASRLTWHRDVDHVSHGSPPVRLPSKHASAVSQIVSSARTNLCPSTGRFIGFTGLYHRLGSILMEKLYTRPPPEAKKQNQTKEQSFLITSAPKEHGPYQALARHSMQISQMLSKRFLQIQTQLPIP